MTPAQHKAPCETCPYRRSVRLAFWDIKEYRQLLEHDANQFGPLFDCHGERKQPTGSRRLCVGWALDQRRRGVPSLLFRLKLMNQPALAKWFSGLRDMKRKLYSSIEEMFFTNYPGGKWRPMQPKRKARRR